MQKVRLGDVIIFLLATLLIVFSFTFYKGLSGRPEVRVRADGGEWVYDLAADTTATFKGPVGETTIEIKEGRVRVVDSDCKNKVCIAAGWISSPGQWIICLPNNVFVRLEGSLKGGTIDDLSF
ncbi:MAG: NusG domain II-containing protein [Sphaerochaetaceae bacterium]